MFIMSPSSSPGNPRRNLKLIWPCHPTTRTTWTRAMRRHRAPRQTRCLGKSTQDESKTSSRAETRIHGCHTQSGEHLESGRTATGRPPYGDSRPLRADVWPLACACREPRWWPHPPLSLNNVWNLRGHWKPGRHCSGRSRRPKTTCSAYGDVAAARRRAGAPHAARAARNCQSLVSRTSNAMRRGSCRSQSQNFLSLSALGSLNQRCCRNVSEATPLVARAATLRLCRRRGVGGVGRRVGTPPAQVVAGAAAWSHRARRSAGALASWELRRRCPRAP